MNLIYRDGISFEKWMESVDQLLVNITGFDSMDLPDFLWMDAFEDRATPRDAIEEFLDKENLR